MKFNFTAGKPFNIIVIAESMFIKLFLFLGRVILLVTMMREM